MATTQIASSSPPLVENPNLSPPRNQFSQARRALVFTVAFAACFVLGSVYGAAPTLLYSTAALAVGCLNLTTVLFYHYYSNPVVQIKRAVVNKTWNAIPSIFEQEPRLFKEPFLFMGHMGHVMGYLIINKVPVECIEKVYDMCAPEGSEIRTEFETNDRGYSLRRALVEEVRLENWGTDANRRPNGQTKSIFYLRNLNAIAFAVLTLQKDLESDYEIPTELYHFLHRFDWVRESYTP